MSGPGDSDPVNGAPEDAAGVLANLPRTRPQRSSPRRAAARAAAGDPPSPPAATRTAPPPGRRRAAGAKAAGKPAAKPARAAKTAKRAPKQAPAPEPVPRQGYETEGERVYGSVAPPGGAEVLATAAEAVVELARTGLSGGERLLRDLLSRLPGS